MALRERLVAMYETGTPDLLSVLVEAGGYDELVNRTEYLNRINGLDEAVVTRVRDLRDQVKRTVARLRSAKNRIESARDAIAAEEQALASARSAVQQRQATLVAARRDREAALATITTRPSTSSTATWPRSRPKSPRRWPARARRRCPPARSRAATAAA